MIGSESGSTRRSCGRVAVTGSVCRTWSSRSRTFSIAKSMSVPHPNRRVTRLTPSRETEVIRSSPGVDATWASTRSVTSRSTSVDEVWGIDV
jgi:hypothetical protein